MPTITIEIWIAMAKLAHTANNIRHSASIDDLKNQIRQSFNDQRPGVAIHISQHVVAQKKLNTGYNKCFLSETGRGLRRLYLPSDAIHESRIYKPVTMPSRKDIPKNYQYLLDWYLAETQNFKISALPSPVLKTMQAKEKNTDKTTDLIQNFRTYLDYFNNNIKFSGPSIYFHKKTIEKVRTTQDYSALLADNYFIELVYATLVSWGMNTMGQKGPKMVDFEDFITGIDHTKEQLVELKKYKLQTLTKDQFNQINPLLRSVFEKLQTMASSSRIVGNSKVMHHLLPDLVPPIDRTHTLKFFYGHMNIIRDESEVFLECMDKFYKIARSVPGIAAIPMTDFNTSIPKIIDNAIMGHVMQNNKRRAGAQGTSRTAHGTSLSC